jgi:hypothetical protein
MSEVLLDHLELRTYSDGVTSDVREIEVNSWELISQFMGIYNTNKGNYGPYVIESIEYSNKNGYLRGVVRIRRRIPFP